MLRLALLQLVLLLLLLLPPFHTSTAAMQLNLHVPSTELLPQKEPNQISSTCPLLLLLLVLVLPTQVLPFLLRLLR